jgi:two-component system LytT family sensor kinase
LQIAVLFTPSKSAQMNLRISRAHVISIFSWLAAYIVLFYYVRSCSYNKQAGINLAVSAIDILCLMLCSLCLRKLLIPKLLYRKKIILFALVLMLLLVFFALLMQVVHFVWYSVTDSLSSDASSIFRHYYYQLFSCWWVVLCGCLSIIAFKLIQDQWLAITRFNELQKEKAQTELSFLKGQINPHFLFNSINSIFANIDKSNTLARETVLKFSDMLRYQLYECNIDKISFEKEYAYLHNYVALQRLRKDNNLEVSMQKTGELTDFSIAPLLLIPFIENAFKYASNHSDKRNFVQVTFVKKDQSFNFHCINTKEPIRSRKLFEDGGIGIQNVRRRLELIYPGRHELHISDDESVFQVYLSIKTKTE